jgi:hypothetical protein
MRDLTIRSVVKRSQMVPKRTIVYSVGGLTPVYTQRGSDWLFRFHGALQERCGCLRLQCLHWRGDVWRARCHSPSPSILSAAQRPARFVTLLGPIPIFHFNYILLTHMSNTHPETLLTKYIPRTGTAYVGC